VTIHIRPTAALAERALLPEDPGLAMALAQALLDRPLMFNHSHGLWGYTGRAADGRPLTVQSTGIGGPSAAVVLAELAALGLRRAIRVGTCAALAAGLDLGALIIAAQALAVDGAGAPAPADGDARLTAGLRAAAPDVRHGLVASTDVFYALDGAGRWAGGDGGAAWRAAGILAVELESATLFALGARLRVAIAGVLAVTDLVSPDARRIDDDAGAAAAQAAGRLGLAALTP
jgi:uridine phosphorylase